MKTIGVVTGLWFSGRSELERVLVQALGQAQKEVLLCVYAMPRAPGILSALDLARARLGHDAVRVVVDRRASSGAPVPEDAARITFGPRGKSGRMHHKFLVLDGERVLTGSWNFGTAASHDALLQIEGEDAAAAFIQEFLYLEDAAVREPPENAGEQLCEGPEVSRLLEEAESKGVQFGAECRRYLDAHGGITAGQLGHLRDLLNASAVVRLGMLAEGVQGARTKESPPDDYDPGDGW